ncbi:PaaI family thioesterase [Pseudonocardia sp. NPDC049154]|uniref:PaaI family thioesterase n=1 Tax=Pseudonocardia sp. NPDC049154 TaxID=3155501 RepID=UPI00340114E9
MSETTTRTEKLSRFWEAMPFNAKCHIQVRSWEEEKVVLAAAYAEDQTNGHGTLHGGVIGTLADTAATAVVMAGRERGDKRTPLTTAMTVHYLGAARSTVIATATVSRRGGSTSFVDVAVVDAEGAPVATAMICIVMK